MRKYRVVERFDEHNLFVCLVCKQKFTCGTSPVEEKWRACPFCSVVWDGEFTTRNPRYRLSSDSDDYVYDGVSFLVCHNPRLIIETRNFVDRRLSPDGFYAQACEPHYTQWRLVSHCRLGVNFNGKSSAVAMNDLFEKYKLTYSNLRLRLMSGTTSRIIKEWKTHESDIHIKKST